MNKKKGLRYYLTILGFATLALFAYVSYLAYRSGGYDMTIIWSLIYVPPLFTLFLFMFDKLFDKIMPAGPSKDQDFSAFAKELNESIDDIESFTIDDYRRVRTDPKFQKALHQLYRIYIDGETADLNFTIMEKKFKKDSKQAIALDVIVKQVKQMMKNSEKTVK